MTADQTLALGLIAILFCVPFVAFTAKHIWDNRHDCLRAIRVLRSRLHRLGLHSKVSLFAAD